MTDHSCCQHPHGREHIVMPAPYLSQHADQIHAYGPDRRDAPAHHSPVEQDHTSASHSGGHDWAAPPSQKPIQPHTQQANMQPGDGQHMGNTVILIQFLQVLVQPVFFSQQHPGQHRCFPGGKPPIEPIL